MARRFGGDCCHYDEGYEDGFEDGKDDRAFERNDVVEALRVVSRRWFLAGRVDESDLLAEAANEIERDTSTERQVKAERERVENLTKLYKVERAAA